MRTFEKTHPWITFNVNLSKASHKLWMALGEAQSKCEHIAGVPLHPEVNDLLHRVYLAKGVHATTAIEGNTLSEEQVHERLKGELSLPPSQEYLGKEIDNIIRGCNEIARDIMNGGPTDINVEGIKKFNAIVLEGLKLNEDVIPGQIRQHSVGVAGYRGAPSEECEYLLERLCDWLNNEEFKQKDSLIAFGILRAILAHIYLAWIHPFGDGNGRTARLIEFKILLAHGVPSPAAHLLSNHYNQTRSEYYRQLDYSSKAKGDVIPFIEYAVQGFIDGLKEQLKVVQGQQMRIMWRDFIYENFRNKSGASFDRKRKLILDIADNLAIIPFKQIRHISPRIAELYANKTDKAIRRDINVLIEMDLLKREPKGYRARWEKLRAFLPERMVE
jgi:Fic family protein